MIWLVGVVKLYYNVILLAHHLNKDSCITEMEQALVCACTCTQDVLKNMLIQYMQGEKNVGVHVCTLMHLGMKPLFY